MSDDTLDSLVLLQQMQKQQERRTKNTNKEAEISRELTKNSVTKSNALIRAYYRFTLSEKRCMEALISKLHPMRGDNAPVITLTALEYSKAYSTPLNHAYGHIAKAVDGLLHKVIIVKENETTTLKINLTSQARYKQNLGIIEVEFNSKIYPHLVGLREKFTSYPLKHAAPFTSSYTWRFYELLMSWAKPKSQTGGLFAGWLKIEVDEIRKQLGVPKSYRFDNFQNQVLDVAIKELKEKAHIYLHIERIKTSRKITHLNIQFIQQKPENKGGTEEEQNELAV